MATGGALQYRTYNTSFCFFFSFKFEEGAAHCWRHGGPLVSKIRNLLSLFFFVSFSVLLKKARRAIGDGGTFQYRIYDNCFCFFPTLQVGVVRFSRAGPPSPLPVLLLLLPLLPPPSGSPRVARRSFFCLYIASTIGDDGSPQSR